MVGLGTINGFNKKKLFSSVRDVIKQKKKPSISGQAQEQQTIGSMGTVFETMEPRLLLSAESLTASEIAHLHEKLAEQLNQFDLFLTQYESNEAVNNGSLQLPFIDQESDGFFGQLGNVLDYSEIVSDTFIQKLENGLDLISFIPPKAEGEEETITAADYSKFLNSLFVSDTAQHQSNFTVEKSANGLLTVNFDVTLADGKSFDLDLSGLGENIKLTHAQETQVDIEHIVSFDFVLDTNNKQNSGNFDDLSIGSTINVGAELTGALIKLGLFDFKVGEGLLDGDKELNYTLGVSVGLADPNQSFTFGNDSSVSSEQLLDVGFDYSENQQIVDLKLSLDQDQLVNGLDIPQDSSITVTTASDHSLNDADIALQEELAELTLFDANTLYKALESLVARIDTIFSHDAFEFEIPFLSELELSEIFSLRESLQTNLLDAFVPVLDLVGLDDFDGNNDDQSKSELLGTEIQLDDDGSLIQPISSDFSFFITLSDGTRELIKWYPTEQQPELTSMDALVTALSASIAANTNLSDRLSVVNAGNRLKFSDSEAKSNADKVIRISDPQRHLAVDSIDDVVVAFAKALGNDVADVTDEKVKEWASNLNLRFEDNAVKFDLSFSLPSVSTELSLDQGFAIGDFTGINSEGALTLETDAIFDMTLGLDLTPLGEGAGIDQDSVLEQLKIWSEGIEAKEEGAELTIMAPDGTLVEVQVSGSNSIQDVVANINAAAEASKPDGALEASFKAEYDAELQKIVITQNDQPANAVILDGPVTSRPSMVDGNYQSVILLKVGEEGSLQATQMAEGWSTNDESQIVITIGNLAPIIVTVDESPAGKERDLDGFIKAFNEALAQLSLQPSDLGLEASDLNSADLENNLNWGQIVKAVNLGGTEQYSIVFTPDTILAVDTQTDEDGNVLRDFSSNAAKIFGMSSMSLGNVEFSVLANSDSMVAQVLGLVGAADAKGKIYSGDLHGQNTGDRVFLEDTGFSGVVTSELEGVKLKGDIGMLGVTADLNGYLSLGASVDLADDDNRVDLNQLLEAANTGNTESLVSADFFSGKGEGLLASFDIGNVIANIEGTEENQSEVKMDGLSLNAWVELPQWQDNQLNSPVVNYDFQGLDSIGSLSSMSYADMVEGLQTILSTLDSLLGAGFYDATLPLIDLSLKDILDVTGDFAEKLDQVKDDPDLALNAVEAEIEKMLSIPAEAFDIRYQADHDEGPVILLELNYELLGFEKSVALNVDLQELLQGVDDETVRKYLEGVGSLVGIGASGDLDLTLSSTLTALMGIKLSSATTPARGDTLLSELNNGQGIPTSGSDQADITFTLKSGEKLELDFDALNLSTATLDDAVAAINGLSDELEASLEDGQIVLTDSSTAPNTNVIGLETLGVSETELTPPNSFNFDILASGFDPKDAIQFEVAIGEQTIMLSLEGDSERDLSQWVKEINRELSKGLLAYNSESGEANQHAFWSSLLAFELSDAGDLSLTSDVATWEKLGFAPDAIVRLSDVQTEEATLVISGVTDSDILHALGLAELETEDSNRWTSSTLTVMNDGDRFFLDTNKTGLKINAELAGHNLDFKTYLGALELEVRDGTVVISGDDADEVSSDDFSITADGNVSLKEDQQDDNNLAFKFGLSDEGANSDGDDDSLLFFSEFGQIDHTFVDTSLTGGAQALLPIYVAGVNVGEVVINVSDIVNESGEREIDIQTPDFASMFEELSYLNNPEILISGLDTFFASLDKILTDSVFGFEIPVIGNALEGAGDFVSNLRNAIVPALWQELEEFKLNYPGVPPTTSTLIASVLEEQLTALGWQGVYVTGNENVESKSVDFTLGFEYQLFNENIDLDADFGFPGLGLSVQDGTVGVSAVAKMELGFGFSIENGFYLDDGVSDQQDRNELELIIAADFSNMPELSASLGILQASVSNNKDSNSPSTSLTGTIGIDLNDANGDGIMTFDEMKGQKYMVEAIAKFDTLLNLQIDAGFNDVLPVSLPAISANLFFDHSYEKVLYGEKHEVMTVEAFELRDITLDVGEFLEGFLKPVLGFVDDALDPIRPVLDFLTSPVPGISDIIGNTSLLEIGKMASGANPSFDSAVKFVDTVNQVDQLIRLLNNTPELKINFGTYDFGSKTDPFSGGLSTHEFDMANLSGGAFNADDPYASLAEKDQALANALQGKTTGSESSSSETKYGLSLPILTDPMMALRLLSGDMSNIDLFLWHFPSFALSFDKTIGAKIPGVPKVGLSADVEISVDVGFDLAFGYDTSGFMKMVDSGNAKYILDGFYIADYENGREKPEAWFDTTIALDANVDLFLFKAGVEGYLSAAFDADLTDPNEDGKIRASEFIQLITDTPEYLFEIDGKITAGIDVYFDIYFNYLFGKKKIAGDSWAILPEQTIIDFSHNYEPKLSLGNVDNGKLILNMGDYAGERTVGELIDGNEEFRIVQSGNDVLVYSDLYKDGKEAQRYSGVDEILIKSGAGDDVLRFDNFNSDISIDIDTGTGNDKVIFNTPTVYAAALSAKSSSTNITIRGGDGNDEIRVGSGNYTIYGGDGDDTIITGSGNNTIYGEAGDDQITTGFGNDYIDGGVGNDTLKTLGGENKLIGDRGDDVIIGGTGKDTISGGLGDDRILADGGTIDLHSMKSTSTAGGADTIHGGDGDDLIIAGAGEDSIDGEHGNDTIVADLGEIGFGASNITFAEATGTAGGNDTIKGGFGQDIILAGAGSDTLDGGDGVDVLIGDNGFVDGADGGQTLGEFVSRATEFSHSVSNSNDIITGGVGRDIIFGGAGDDKLYGEEGSDIILGDHGEVIRQTTFSAAYTSIKSEHSVQDGNDIIVAAGGSNTVVGGSGSDLITASPETAQDTVGNNVLIGDHAEIQPAGTTLGSNPVADIRSTYEAYGSADTITGSSAMDVLVGGVGNDVLNAGEGNDLIIGDIAEITRAESLYVLEAKSTNTAIAGNDTVHASGGDNLVIGGLGNDTVTTASGQDIVLGDLGVITGATVDRSTVKFSSKESALGGNDVITSGAGADVIIAGDGNDEIDSGLGSDVVLGDNGVVNGQAHFSYDQELDAEIVAGWDFVEANSGDTLDEPNGGDDTINSGQDNDIVIAGSGNDTVSGGAGNDVLLGDFGVVIPANGNTADVVGRNASHGGDDTITDQEGNDVIVGGGGADTIESGAGVDLILGDNGNVTRSDEVSGSKLVVLESIEESYGGNDVIDAGSDHDVVIAGAGDDQIMGGEGNDVLLGDLGIVIPANGTTPDVIARNGANGGKDIIYGNQGNDVIAGGGDDDTLHGDEGRDLILGDNGNVTRSDEASGWNLVSIESTEEAQSGNDVIDAGSDHDVVIAGAGDDQIMGGEGNDVLLGDLGIVIPANGTTPDVIARNAANGGKDTIYGNQGNDVIAGGGDDDALHGDEGRDLILGDNGNVTRSDEASGWNLVSIESTEEAQGGNDVIDAGSDHDVVIAGTGDDQITGGEGEDVLLGDLGIVTSANGTTPDVVARNAANGGKDTIHGNQGNDVIAGGGDNDTLHGDEDRDLILGDNGNVTRSDEASGWNLVSIESTEEAQGGNDVIDAGSDHDVVIAGTGDDQITGGEGDDVLLGDLGIVTSANGTMPDVIARNAANGGKDTIYGNQGNDVIAGGGDDDALHGDEGRDLILGDNGNVTRSAEASGWNLVNIESTEEAQGGNDTIVAGSGDDVVIAGVGSDNIQGNSGVDVLLGDLGIVVPANGSRADVVSRNAELGGDDTISAGAGNDVVIGSHGQDTLDGDAGHDVILGDSGYVIRNSANQALKVETTQVEIGDNDSILAGEGDDFVFGGQGDDSIVGEQGRDIMFGDAGYQINDDNWIAREMVSTDFSIGGNDTITGNQGEDFAIGGIGNDFISGDEGRDTLIGDQGEFKWLSNGHRDSAKSIALPNVVGQFNDELRGGLDNDNLFGGRDDDKLYGGLASDILVGDEGNIFFKNDLEFIAQSKESFTGGADVMHLGTWGNNNEGIDLSQDFLLGGEQPNFNYADALLDMILHENAHVEINPERIGEWDEPPFLGDPVATTTDDFFSLDNEMNDLIDELGTNPSSSKSTTYVKSALSSINLDASQSSREQNTATHTAEVLSLNATKQVVSNDSDLLNDVVGQDTEGSTGVSTATVTTSSPAVSSPTNNGKPEGASGTESGAPSSNDAQSTQPNSNPESSSDEEAELEDQLGNLLFFDAQLGLWVKAQPEAGIRIQDEQPKVRII